MLSQPDNENKWPPDLATVKPDDCTRPTSLAARRIAVKCLLSKYPGQTCLLPYTQPIEQMNVLTQQLRIRAQAVCATH